MTNTLLPAQQYEIDVASMIGVPEPGSRATLPGGTWAMACFLSKKLRAIVPALAFAAVVAHAAPLVPDCGPVTPGIAPNPGGATVVTNSTTCSSITYTDTPVTQRIDQYSTTLKAVLNGTQTVFQQTYALPFSDPVVQAAVAQADAILAGNKATFTSPKLISNTSLLQSSVLSYVQTTPPFDDSLCNTGSNPLVCPNVTFTVSTTSTFGPATIKVGELMSQSFTIFAGQLDINENVDKAYNLTRNAVTTNTFLTTQSYEIDGASSAVTGVPEPGSWTLLLTGSGGLILLGWKTRRSRA